MTTTNARPCPTCNHPDRHTLLAGCTHANIMEAEASGTWCACTDHDGWTRAQAALPSTPYDGGTSSGHSGSETSAARSATEDADGTTKARQAKVLDVLAANPTTGVTVKDLRGRTGWHHGQASSALSNLHHAGLIARLTETRDRCKVYVLPEFVGGRMQEDHGRKPKGPTRSMVRKVITDAYYDARNEGRTMEDAADQAADAVMGLWA